MERSSFFNNKDYQSEDFARYFSSIISNGVFPNPSTNLQVMGEGIYSLTINPGYAWINGYFYENTQSKTIIVDVADAVLNRKDLIVLRLDLTNGLLETALVKGTPQTNAVAPELTRNEVVYELALAEISVKKAATGISQMDILDTRLDNERCGIVNSLIQADTTTIFNQFNDWFEAMKNQIVNDDHSVMNEKIDANATAIESIDNLLKNYGSAGTEGLDITNGDLNALPLKNLTFGGQNVSNFPSNLYFIGNRIVYTNSDGKTNAVDIAYRMTSSNNYEMYYRAYTNSLVWQGWVRVETFNRTRFQAGRAIMTPTPNVTSTVRVYFATPFVNQPRVITDLVTSVPHQAFSSIGVATTDYVDINVRRNDNTQTYVEWHASEYTQANTNA